MTDIIAASQRDRTRDGLMRAFEDYRQGKPNSMDRLLQLVTKFVFLKVSHLEYDFRDFGSAETADDWAQEATIKVWQRLEKFHGTPAQFYSWVHKIAFNQATDAFNGLQEGKSQKVALFVSNEEAEGDDQDGSDETIENPLIHNQPGEGFSVRIPKSVRGIDLTICKLLLTEVRGSDGNHRGRNYAEVAQILGMTEAAVNKRLLRLRNRLKAEREREADKRLTGK